MTREMGPTSLNYETEVLAPSTEHTEKVVEPEYCRCVPSR